MDQIKIGEFLKQLRKEKNMTQQEAADALYVSQKTISRWETGEGIMDISIIQEVAAFYGVTVDELLSGERKANIQIDIKNNTKKEININKTMNIYLFSSLGALLFLSLLGLILTSVLLNERLVFLFTFIGFLTSLGIYLFGYFDNKNIIKNNKSIITKNLIFSDIYFVCLIIYIYPILELEYRLMNYKTTLLIIYLIFVYFWIRKIFIYNEKDIVLIKKKMNLVLMITQIFFVLTIFGFKIKYSYGGMNQLDPNIIFSLYFEKLIPDYTFRIIGGIFMALSITGIIFSYIKNKKILSIISFVCGIISSIIIYMDLYLFNWSKIIEKQLIISPIGILFIIIYLLLYISKKIKMKNYS